MNEPLDTQAVEWLAGLLRAIHTANGYHTDAGTEVYTEQLDMLAEDVHIARIGIEDGGEATNGQGRLHRNAELTCSLQVVVPVTIGNARTLCRRVLYDMRLALAQAKRRGSWPVGITGLEIGARRLEQREDSAHVISGDLTAIVKYAEHYQETTS